jgi:hypothetical protein
MRAVALTDITFLYCGTLLCWSAQGYCTDVSLLKWPRLFEDRAAKVNLYPLPPSTLIQPGLGWGANDPGCGVWLESVCLLCQFA